MNIGFRDELYRTARDVAELANIRENVDEIDRYVAYLAARGKSLEITHINDERNEENLYSIIYITT